jgi:hypothetical protein
MVEKQQVIQEQETVQMQQKAQNMESSVQSGNQFTDITVKEEKPVLDRVQKNIAKEIVNRQVVNEKLVNYEIEVREKPIERIFQHEPKEVLIKENPIFEEKGKDMTDAERQRVYTMLNVKGGERYIDNEGVEVIYAQPEIRRVHRVVKRRIIRPIITEIVEQPVYEIVEQPVHRVTAMQEQTRGETVQYTSTTSAQQTTEKTEITQASTPKSLAPDQQSMAQQQEVAGMIQKEQQVFQQPYQQQFFLQPYQQQMMQQPFLQQPFLQQPFLQQPIQEYQILYQPYQQQMFQQPIQMEGFQQPQERREGLFRRIFTRKENQAAPEQQQMYGTYGQMTYLS